MYRSSIKLRKPWCRANATDAMNCHNRGIPPAKSVVHRLLLQMHAKHPCPWMLVKQQLDIFRCKQVQKTYLLIKDKLSPRLYHFIGIETATTAVSSSVIVPTKSNRIGLSSRVFHHITAWFGGITLFKLINSKEQHCINLYSHAFSENMEAGLVILFACGLFEVRALNYYNGQICFGCRSDTSSACLRRIFLLITPERRGEIIYII